ncbi:MAG: signal recognition particle-docking protein FtsY [Firmicutes bacterium]|nr:signal recognition particle-docking protein FtsY [Bacillota bacterium]MCL5038405.1 signal recognition particle-docking protein FtsY [Bacillota bacterium]
MFERKGLLTRFKEGLARTRQGMVERILDLVSGTKRIDEEFYEELEEILIQADVGVQTTEKLLSELKKSVRQQKVDDPKRVTPLLQEIIVSLLGTNPVELALAPGRLNVIMVVGVNGVGKTTTIGKLAHLLKGEGKKVLLAAGDTFRAAAIEQLEIWGKRAGVEVIRHQEGGDPAAVVFDAIAAARSRRSDVLIVDTAGRLHTKVNLMEELKKVRRVVAREAEGAPHEVLLVLDATTGQNALQQARIFKEATEVTGLILTKLDGTAKGGVVIAVSHQTGLPIKFVGLGEKMEDLKEFQAAEFAAALFDRSPGN